MLRNFGQSSSENGGGNMIDWSLHKVKSTSSRRLEGNLLNAVVPPLVIPSHDIAELIGHPEKMRRENSKNVSNIKSIHLYRE
jgi:hypothetical protein